MPRRSKRVQHFSRVLSTLPVQAQAFWEVRNVAPSRWEQKSI
ncbi:hypothetical protein [Marivita cryptomonadis]|nr:hypothetical protein [Marivita cryptomonadis]